MVVRTILAAALIALLGLFGLFDDGSVVVNASTNSGVSVAVFRIGLMFRMDAMSLGMIGRKPSSVLLNG